MSVEAALREALEMALAQTQDVHTAERDVLPEIQCRVCGSYVVGVYTRHYAQAGSHSHPKFVDEVEHMGGCWISVARAALKEVNAP